MKGGNRHSSRDDSQDSIASMRPPFMKGGNLRSETAKTLGDCGFNEAALHEGRKFGAGR